MPERFGVNFETGWPYIGSREDLFYDWPNENLGGKFKGINKKEIGEFLLERLRKYSKDFGVFFGGPWPYLQQGENGIALHVGDGGRWISLKNYLGRSFISFHNLDAFSDQLAGFVIGADTLEYLDPKILAPRILKQSEEYIIRYPLPNRMDVLPVGSNEWFFKGEGLERIFELVNLGEIKRDYQEGRQIIESKKGVIEIKEGMCEGKGFERWYLCRATFPIAKLLDASFMK